jgi:hypothetical protein
MLDWKTINKNLTNHRHKTKIIHFATIDNEELIQYFIIATMQLWAFEKMDEGVKVAEIEYNEGNYLEFANDAKYYYQLREEITDVIKNVKNEINFNEIIDKCNNSFMDYANTLKND